MVNKRKLKALLLVRDCDPNDVGESWWGYQIASRLSKAVDATILTMPKHGLDGSTIEALPDAEVFECVDWPLGKIHERFNAMAKPGYFKFYYFARKKIRSLLAEQSFDIIHQFTPHSPRYPSPAVGFGIPLILGPYGGSVPVPPGFSDELKRMPWYTKLRGIDKLRMKYDPVLRNSFSSASLVFGTASYMREVFSDLPIKRFEVLLQTGVEELPEVTQPSYSRDNLRLLFVGRLIRTKGLIYAIRAMSLTTTKSNVTLDVLGTGPDLQACQTEVERLGLKDRVRFHGSLSKDEVLDYYRSSQGFIFPSFLDASPKVIIEAASFGLPMITADSGGPASTARSEFAIRVPPIDPKQFTAGLADAIDQFAEHPERMSQMHEAAREFVANNYLWPQKIKTILNHYDEVIGDQKN